MMVPAVSPGGTGTGYMVASCKKESVNTRFREVTPLQRIEEIQRIEEFAPHS